MKFPSIQTFLITGLIFCGSVLAVAKEKPTVHTVTIEAMKFSPESLIMKIGDSVIWINKDIVPHTVTALKKEFDSGELKTNRSWRYSTKEKGQFFYFCSFHPLMRGSLVVK